MATSISSSKILSDDTQSDGRRWLRVKVVCESHTGALLDLFYGPTKVPTSFNFNTWIATNGQTILNRLARDEESAASNVNAVEDPLVFALNPEWSTTQRIVKSLLQWMMTERDMRTVLYLKPLIVHLQQNYNGSELATLLEVPVAQVLRLNRRINAVLQDTGTVETLLAAYDVEEGEL